MILAHDSDQESLLVELFWAFIAPNLWRHSANSLASVIINFIKVTLRLKDNSYIELSAKQ
jgi:hypothetical protein